MSREFDPACRLHKKLAACLSNSMYEQVMKVYEQLVIDTSEESLNNTILNADKQIAYNQPITKVDRWYLYILLVCILDVEQDVYATL